MEHRQRDQRILAASVFLTVQFAYRFGNIVHCAVGQSNHLGFAAGTAAVHVTHNVLVRADNLRGFAFFRQRGIGIYALFTFALATRIPFEQRRKNPLVVGNRAAHRNGCHVGKRLVRGVERVEEKHGFAARFCHDVRNRRHAHTRVNETCHDAEFRACVKRRNALRTGRQVQRNDIALLQSEVGKRRRQAFDFSQNATYANGTPVEIPLPAPVDMLL